MPGRPAMWALTARAFLPSSAPSFSLAWAWALTIYTGHISASDFWAWYGRWWPLLLIGAGLALLGEWALDLKRETPVPRGGSFVGILILLAFLGVGAAGYNHMGPWFNNWGNHDDLDRKST